MTIEQNIIDLTTAIRELTFALNAPKTNVYTPYAPGNYPKAPDALEPLTPPVDQTQSAPYLHVLNYAENEAAEKKRLATPSEGLTSPAAEAEKATAPTEGAARPAVSRDEVVAKFKTLAAKNRDAAVAVLKTAGVAKLSEVPDDKLATVLNWIFVQSQR